MHAIYDREGYGPEERGRKRSQREEALSKTRIPLRAGFRDHGTVLRQSKPHRVSMPFQPEKFIVAPTTNARDDSKLELAAEILRSGGSIRLRALGTSMLPAIWPGDVLTIENQSWNQMVRGDIVLTQRGGRFFVHRLIEKQSQGRPLWITRGDALPRTDPPTAPDDLLGKISSIRRGNRIIIPKRRGSLLSGKLGWALCRWDSFRNIVLRLHSWWQRAGPLWGRAEQQSSAISSASCSANAND